MSIDLERSLDELARSVHDDALATRMNGQVSRMVAQVRRRRAARYTGTSVIGMSAAAAVVVGGVQLSGRGEGLAPVATDGPDATTSPVVAALLCGGTDIPDPADAPDETFVMMGGAEPTVAYGEDVPLSMTLMSANAQTFTIDSTTQIAVLDDGVVVGSAEVDSERLGLLPGVDAAPDSAVGLVACAGDTPLNGGEYELVAWVTVTLNDGTVRTVVSDPLPFTIGENPLDGVEDDRRRRVALEQILATQPTAEFPLCASVVPPTTDALITLTVTLDGDTYAAGESFIARAGVWSASDLPEGAQLSVHSPQVVLTRDGVVVGRASREAPLELPIELNADGGFFVEAPGTTLLCDLPGTAATEAPLPPGTYQAYALATVTVHEDAVDGVEAVPWEPVLVRSEPADVTID